ncbi:hypothetical protein A9P79_25865 [Cupriavidus taiwanensis]|nr:hypothetical protein A9P79_25865 [Cupriavidus taiwanensis]
MPFRFIELNAFRAKSEMRFLFRLSSAISDLVRCTETDEVSRFIRGEGVGGNAEDLADFIAIPPFQFTNYPAGCHQSTRAPCAHEDDCCDHAATVTLNIVGKLG